MDGAPPSHCPAPSRAVAPRSRSWTHGQRPSLTSANGPGVAVVRRNYAGACAWLVARSQFCMWWRSATASGTMLEQTR